MKHIKMKYGFTLMELLVVVIIIAVLSAVAVPMYKHAALKSRFSTVMPMAKAVADAQEVYFQGRQMYALSPDELDVTPVTTENTSVVLSKEEEEDKFAYVVAKHSDVPGARYIIYQKYSPRFASNIHCEAAVDNENALWLCEKGLHGTEVAGSLQGSGYKTYLLSGTVDAKSAFIICPENTTCDKNTGDVTGCISGYCNKDGACVACDYTGTSECGGRGNHCGDGKTFGDHSRCTRGAMCEDATFSDEASCYGGNSYCNRSTFTEKSTCSGTLSSRPLCRGTIFRDDSSCDGGACESLTIYGTTQFTDNSVCKGISNCAGAIFDGNSICTSTFVSMGEKGCSYDQYSEYKSTFKENAVCAGVGCNTATYQGNACCAVAECSGYHIPKCTQSVTDGETVYTRTNTYWDED